MSNEYTLITRMLTTAGWLAMASAFFTLPMVYFSFQLSSSTDVGSITILTMIEVAGTIMLIGILWYLKLFLNGLFEFGDTNKNINLLISLGIITGMLSVAAHYVLPLKETIENIALVILIFQGGVQVHFGYKLMKLPSDLGGLLKPFCYINIVTGVLMASVVMIPLAIFVSAVSDVMLGTIFFNMSKLLKNNESKS